MQGVDYENFMSLFRGLCKNVEKIAQAQATLIELLEGQAVRPTSRAVDAATAPEISDTPDSPPRN